MKKLVAIIFLLLAMGAPANAWEVEPRVNHIVYNNNMDDQSNSRFQSALELRIYKDWFFVNVGQEKLIYHGMPYDINSAGVGARVEILKGLTGTINLAYYMPQGNGAMPYESGWYWMNRQWAWAHGFQTFDRYELEISPNYGVVIGLDYKKNIWKNVAISIGAAYRWLTLDEEYSAYWGSSLSYLYGRQGDFGGMIGSISISVAF